MPLMPKRTKFRKMQKGRMRGKATRGNKISDGEYGIQAVTGGLITGNQIEAARIAMTRYIKRGGKVWIKSFQTNQSLLNQLELVWVKEKVLQNIG